MTALMLPRVPFLVPSVLALALESFIVSSLGLTPIAWLVTGYVLLSYLIALLGIATSPAGRLRIVVSISLSIVLATPLASGLIAVYKYESLATTYEMSFLLPMTMFVVAVSIKLTELLSHQYQKWHRSSKGNALQ